jgi:hypothetical protein
LWLQPASGSIDRISIQSLQSLGVPKTRYTKIESWFGGRMNKALGMMLLLAGVSSLAMAATAAVPEIGAGSAGSAMALVSGALLVIRGRRKK